MSAQALVLNATALPLNKPSSLTLWPDREVQPNASALDTQAAGTTSNLTARCPTPQGRGPESNLIERHHGEACKDPTS